MEKISSGLRTDMPAYFPIMSMRRILFGFLSSTFSGISSASSLITSNL